MSEEMKEGVNELIKTHEGRKHLAELQKRHEIDMLQPKNPDGTDNAKFYNVYGKSIAEQKEIKHKEESSAQAEWHETRERREHEQRKRNHEGRRFF